MKSNRGKNLQNRQRKHPNGKLCGTFIDPERIDLGTRKVILRGLADGMEPLELAVELAKRLPAGNRWVPDATDEQLACHAEAIREIGRRYSDEIAIYREGGAPESFQADETKLVNDVPLKCSGHPKENGRMYSFRVGNNGGLAAVQVEV